MQQKLSKQMFTLLYSRMLEPKILIPWNMKA